MDNSQPKLSCHNLWKLYGPNAERLFQELGGTLTQGQIRDHNLVAAVRGVDLEVYEGEILIVMGLSGSGKSTLVRLMSRLVEPTGGGLLYDGQDLLSASRKDLIDIRRHEMGMVFQHFALLPHLTVLDNVAFPLEIQGVPRSERRRRALDVVNLVGLGGRESYYPGELSGGQQQRVGIARSLAVEPKLWFLDEPFSALDPLIRREMQDEFLRLQKMLHKTIVFITHDFEEAIRLADRVAIMKDGQVVQVGTPEDLVVAPVNDYVRKFTEHVVRAKVVTIGHLMSKPDPAARYDDSVRFADTIADVADKVERSAGNVAVRDQDDIIVGAINRQKIIDVLIGRGET